MASENKSKHSNSNNNNKKRKHYLPHNKPVKKGSYPLRPGVEGFFITCDGGREYQASHEAINVIDSFFEELVEGTESKFEQAKQSKEPMNKIIKFDSSSSDDDDDDDGDKDTNTDGHNVQTGEDKEKPVIATSGDVSNEPGPQNVEGVSVEKQMEGKKEKSENLNNQDNETVQQPAKKHCVEADALNCGNGFSKKTGEKSIDRLIEAELAELGDKSKRRFCKLESGCNGVVFIQMRKRDEDPSPKDIVQHMMTSLASTKKHVSRFLLRVLPIEASCYTSDEEIKQAIKPVIEKHFPADTQNPRKFAVLYDARANTGIDRSKIIDAVAKCVPPIHKVDLGNPDINIVVQIVKTVCLIGIVEKYKELSKYNVRQLTSLTE